MKKRSRYVRSSKSNTKRRAYYKTRLGAQTDLHYQGRAAATAIPSIWARGHGRQNFGQRETPSNLVIRTQHQTIWAKEHSTSERRLALIRGPGEVLLELHPPHPIFFHVGQTKLGNNFSTAYPGFDAGVMEPFRDFLHRVYPEAGASSYLSPQQQEGSSGTGGDTMDSSSYLDVFKAGSTSGSVSNALSTGDVSSDIQSTQHDTSLAGLLLQSPILPESLTTAPLPPSHGTCDDWTTPDLDIFLSNLDVQMGLEPQAGASEIATLTMAPLPPASPFTASAATLPDTSSSILPAVSHTPQLDTTSTPPPDTILDTLPAIPHIPQPVTTSGHPPDTSSSAESLTSELPLTSTTPSFDVDPLAPTPGSDRLDDIDINDGTVLETRRTKRIPKPSTRNDAANAIGASRKENKRPRAEMSSDHASK
ncbi:hypothetical protein P692DRAFT_201804246 [Suillus brevipes Sb2]|nr:hypothetical protein P692DRAFT_201804246 [Suillus brevipes Sb2]